jgi:hypothetical protein
MTAEPIITRSLAVETIAFDDYVEAASLGAFTSLYPPANYLGQNVIFVNTTDSTHTLLKASSVQWNTQAAPRLSDGANSRRFTLHNYKGKSYEGEVNYS